jgi:hypothetical protein
MGEKIDLKFSDLFSRRRYKGELKEVRIEGTPDGFVTYEIINHNFNLNKNVRWSIKNFIKRELGVDRHDIMLSINKEGRIFVAVAAKK